MPLPLFDAYPVLRENIPYQPVAHLPTPVEPLSQLSEALGGDVWIKCDDRSGYLYGGNKVRKLGFLLAAASKDGCKTVLTFGAAGSNHALATAIYAKEMGLNTISMLVPQPNAHTVRRNLLRHHLAGAELHHHLGITHVAAATAYQFALRGARDGQFPRVIPTGGSSPTGILGFVNAAFELQQQVEQGALPKPDTIYVPSGTMGTAVGLALGLRLAGLDTEVQAIRVTAERFSNAERGRKLFQATHRALTENGAQIPALSLEDSGLRLRDGFFGKQYALYTEEGVAAMRRLEEAEGVKLEGTYTGKALAALFADAEAGALRGKTTLFWNTYNSVDQTDMIEGLDYHHLPEPFHRYFEQPVQPLDTQG